MPIMQHPMRSLAQELAPFAIRVSGVAPGAIRTPINWAAWEKYHDLTTLIPYKRIGEPEDIAQAVVWLASDAADYVTGATLFIDGGMTLYPGFATGGSQVIKHIKERRPESRRSAAWERRELCPRTR
jgi:glucose 1-dehydrogenase